VREEELRRILLVKAIEEADADGTLIPPADRAAAARDAMREALVGETALADDAMPAALPPRAQRLLAARSRLLLVRIVARYPFVENVLALLGSAPAITWALIAFGLVLGGGLSVLDGSRRINVLAFPLLGIVVWNVAVYAALLASALRSRRARAAPLRAWLAAAGSSVATRLITRSRAFNAPLADVLRSFANAWFETVRPMLLARAARAFHLAAAALGVGLVAGLYLRGITFDYQAGWESTFLDSSQAHAVLAALYGPAAWITGIPIPDTAQLEAMRWRPGSGGGEPAARWIHLMAASALLYVVVPRLLLALAATTSALRLALRAPVPDSLTPYFRGAFASVEGAVAKTIAIVMPYAWNLPPAALARLIAWVPGAVGGPVEVQACESVPYGEEARYLATLGERGAARADVVVLPFSLSTTPEDENHGAVLAGVRDRLAAVRPQARLLVVVDEAAYGERMAGVPERMAERRELWRRFVEARGLTPTFVGVAS